MPQESMMLPTATLSPASKAVTALPTSMISPVISCPGTRGKVLP